MVKDISEIIGSDITNKAKIDPLKISKQLILREVNSLRSNYQFHEKPDPKDVNPLPPRKESYCHAFYRILGLPVISADRSKFYNPGFFGNDAGSDESSRRESIDKNQDPVLKVIEGLREVTNYENTLNFDSEETKLQYRFEMLQFPIKINIMDENKTAFDPDQQTDFVEGRSTFKPARKYLRPFKTVPDLTNNVFPVTNMISAPFVNESNSMVRKTQLNKPYLEFVARIRFSKDIQTSTDNNALITTLKNKIETLSGENSSITTAFDNTLKDMSVIELYVVEKMLTSLYDLCNKTNEEKQKGHNIVSRLLSYFEDDSLSLQKGEVVFDTLDKEIKNREAHVAAMELILSQIPNYSIPGVGTIKNPIKCPLTASFIEFVQPDIINLRNEITELNSEKQKRIQMFNSTNSELFYLLGEVNGIGLIDIITIMLAFWLITPEQLLAFFDNSSFNRMYREPSLHVDVVETRYTSGVSTVSITEAVSALDEIVLNLLKLAEAIVESNETSASSKDST